MSFWSVKKDQKVLFYGCEKVNKNSGFGIYSHLKDSVFIVAAVMGIQSSNLGMWKGYHRSFFNRRLYERGAFLWQKLCRKGLGVGLPRIKLCWEPHPGSTSIIEALIISVLIVCNDDLFWFFILFYFQWKGHQSLAGVSPNNLVFYISFFLSNATPNWRFLYSAQVILPNSSLNASLDYAHFFAKKYLFILITSIVIIQIS